MHPGNMRRDSYRRTTDFGSYMVNPSLASSAVPSSSALDEGQSSRRDGTLVPARAQISTERCGRLCGGSVCVLLERMFGGIESCFF